jgi:histone-lysine N-methyltransferase ASH1L
MKSDRFVGDAATEWKHHKQLPSSRCLCTPDTGCDEDCQNCYMLYECDESNCNVGSANCGNRPFADLKERCKSGRRYDIGVEVLKTEAKGYGVRACRTFEPGQIIMEYAGEIITQEECERRVATEYKDNAVSRETCYAFATVLTKTL